MFKKSSVWLVVLISVVAIAFITTGCAKKTSHQGGDGSNASCRSEESRG